MKCVLTDFLAYGEERNDKLACKHVYSITYKYYRIFQQMFGRGGPPCYIVSYSRGNTDTVMILQQPVET